MLSSRSQRPGNRSFCCAILVALVVIWIQLGAHSQEAEPSPQPARKNSRQKGRLIDAPAAITPKEWEEYCRLLDASEGQRAQFTTLFERYLEECSRIQDTLMAEARELGVSSVKAEGRGVDAEYAAHMEFRAAVQSVRDAMGAADRRLFASIEEFLADLQQPALARVRNQRIRDCQTRQYTTTGRSAVDLVDLARAVLQDNPLPREAVAILEEYDAEITPLVSRLDADRAKTMPQIARIEIILHTKRPDETAEERAELYAQRDALLARLARRETRLADRNEQFAERVCASLPPASAKAYRDQFDRIAYRHLLPDPASPDALVDRILSEQSNPPSVIAAVRARWAAHGDALQPMVNNLRELHRDWKLDFASSFSSRGMAEYQRAVVRQIERICDLHEAFIDDVAGMLSGEALNQVAPQIASWRAALSERRRQISAGNFPPP